MKTTVEAIKYKTKVCEGTLDFVHGCYQIIEEVYIPSIRVCFNDRGFAFLSESPRENIQGKEKIEIDAQVVKKIAQFVKIQQKIKTDCFSAFFNKDLTK